MIDPLPGAVCEQWVPTGRNRKLHGPYHYRMWRENGKLKKQYVKPEDLERTIAACDAYRRQNAESRIIAASIATIKRNLRKLRQHGD